MERVINETIYSVNSIVGKLVEMKSQAEGFISGLEAESLMSVNNYMVTSVEKTVIVEKPVNKTDARETGEKEAVDVKKEPATETGKVETIAEKQAKDDIVKEKEDEIGCPAMKFGEERLSVEKALAELSGPVLGASVKESASDTSTKTAESSDAGSSSKENKVEDPVNDEEDMVQLTVMEEKPEEDSESDADEEDSDFESGFHIEKSLSNIECGSNDDIVEVYQSLNIARITTEGNLTQSARGYVCAVKKRGSVSVFIGLQLTDNNKILVYAPGKQPKARNLRKTVQNAIDFLETAGFLMDSMSLGNDPKSRAKIIGKIPVFGGTH